MDKQLQEQQEQRWEQEEELNGDSYSKYQQVSTTNTTKEFRSIKGKKYPYSTGELLKNSIRKSGCSI